MRVAEAVLVRRRVGAQPRRLRLQQRDAAREIETAGPAGRRCSVAQPRQRAAQPRLVVEADAHEQGRALEPGELSGFTSISVKAGSRRSLLDRPILHGEPGHGVNTLRAPAFRAERLRK